MGFENRLKDPKNNGEGKICEIYCDNLHEGLWFRDLVPTLSDVPLDILKSRGKNPDIIDDLLLYDRPDIIVTNDGNPTLVFEKTSEVPTGHNIGQRVGRIVRAAEHEVPAITFLPFDAMKHGDYAGMCNLNIRLLDAFSKMTEMHNTPVIAVNWPSDTDGELIRDGSQDEFLSAILQSYFVSNFDPDCEGFERAQQSMVEEYNRRLRIRPSYGKPPNSVKILSTEKFVSTMVERLNGNFQLGDLFQSRSETLVYTLEMTPEKCRREDPYTGMQFIYDYQYCRNGPNPQDKFRNLVINCPLISESRWREANPNDASRKSYLWYATANLIALKDGLIQVVD